MPKTILVYANCKNPDAKGDFALAGNIAKDLTKLIGSDSDINVVLTSTMDGIARFKSLYGIPVNNRVTIETQDVGLCILEHFDSVENEVIAFIEANRCKYAPTEILKRALSPTSKILIIGAANQPEEMNTLFGKIQLLQQYQNKQPGIYNHFDAKNIYIGSAGLGDIRMGIPNLTPTDDLPPLSLTEMQKIPTTNYGFMYLASNDISSDTAIIAQYTVLTGFDNYILVGGFANDVPRIHQAIAKEQHAHGAIKFLPSIECHASLGNTLMRNMTAICSGMLLASTGVMSTLEAMSDGKLTFYQNMSNNEYFVASYLLAVKSICTSGKLFDNMPRLVTELSELLFAPKPLSASKMEHLEQLLRLSPVKTNLIDTNIEIIKQANGKLAPRLLSFISSPSNSTNAHAQLNSVCMGLRKPDETRMPVHDQALRRAAFWGRSFELKVLIKAINPHFINKKDASKQEMNALHYAVIGASSDCVRLLLASPNVAVDIQDGCGKTALHHAITKRQKDIVIQLLAAGASLKIKDNNNNGPAEYGDAAMQQVVNNHSSRKPDNCFIS